MAQNTHAAFIHGECQWICQRFCVLATVTSKWSGAKRSTEFPHSNCPWVQNGKQNDFCDWSKRPNKEKIAKIDFIFATADTAHSTKWLIYISSVAARVDYTHTVHTQSRSRRHQRSVTLHVSRFFSVENTHISFQIFSLFVFGRIFLLFFRTRNTQRNEWETREKNAISVLSNRCEWQNKVPYCSLMKVSVSGFNWFMSFSCMHAAAFGGTVQCYIIARFYYYYLFHDWSCDKNDNETTKRNTDWHERYELLLL